MDKFGDPWYIYYPALDYVQNCFSFVSKAGDREWVIEFPKF